MMHGWHPWRLIVIAAFGLVSAGTASASGGFTFVLGAFPVSAPVPHVLPTQPPLNALNLNQQYLLGAYIKCDGFCPDQTTPFRVTLSGDLAAIGDLNGFPLPPPGPDGFQTSSSNNCFVDGFGFNFELIWGVFSIYATPGPHPVTITATNCVDGSVLFSRTFTVNAIGRQLQVAAGIVGGPTATQQVNSGSPLTAHFPLGSNFVISLLDEQGNAVPASFSLGAASVGPGEDATALFHDFAAFQYAMQPSANTASFQAMHLGAVPLTITPSDPTLGTVQLTIIIDNPATLGSAHPEADNLIYPLAQKEGIPPQYIKGQIQRESGFNAEAWRYEPISPAGDLGQVSRGRIPPLREVSPLSFYRLATPSSDGGLSQGALLLQADIDPRGTGPFPLEIIDPDTGLPRPVLPSDPNPTAEVLYEVNDSTQHWSAFARQSTVSAIEQNPSLLNFIAQTTLASSYGYLQILYPTAILTMQWPGITGGVQNPSFLFDAPTNLRNGGGSLTLGTAYLASVYPSVNQNVDTAAPNFNTPTDFQLSFVRGFNCYNSCASSKDSPTYSQAPHGTAVISFAAAYEPSPAEPIFQQ